MSVYIKGMEMPKSCDECRIMTFEDTNCDPELYCGCPIVFKAHPQGVGHRPDYCPLVYVPPHGDLIDRTSLLMDIIHSCVFSGKNGARAEIAGAQKVRNRISAAPIVVPADGGADND